jgi:hypothetical protein
MPEMVVAQMLRLLLFFRFCIISDAFLNVKQTSTRISASPFSTSQRRILQHKIELLPSAPISTGNLCRFLSSAMRNNRIYCLLSSTGRLAATVEDSSNDANRRSSSSWLPLLERTHERFIGIFFSFLSASILYFAGTSGRTVRLPPIEPSTWLVIAETGLSLTWSAMIMAISFLEAWTKFRAPFLKSYIAVDVGRHVFASLNSAELGIVSSFWFHRVFQCYQVHRFIGGDLLYKTKSYYQNFAFTLPAITTVSFLLQVLIVAPKLYIRAKWKILEGFNNALPSVKISMTKAEQVALTDITQDVRYVKKIPSRAWHSLYALLEIVKIGCLNAFVVLSWIKLFDQATISKGVFL